MTAHITTGQRANLVGALWMIAAMAGFAVEDALLKAVSQTLPAGQVLMLFGLGGAVIFASLAKRQREALFVPGVISRPMLLRVCFEIFGRLFYFLAIALTPLSSATVILQATPLVVVAGAAIVFGEKVGWRRWSAVLLGLIGVMIILQPGSSSFSVLSILALIGMLGFAGRDLASRAAPASLGTNILGLYGFLPIILAGGLFALWDGAAFVRPTTQALLFLTGATLAGVFAYASLMKAMRTGDVSAVTPFRYTRLLFGLALGMFVFGEEITLTMGFGAGLIVVSGLFVLWRGKQAQG